MNITPHHWSSRLPFYYGWLIIGIAFVTMAIAVTARTAFSLLLPPLINEFGWDRGLVAGAFSFGFLVSAVVSPFVGRIMDRHGPRIVIETGVGLLASGLLLAPAIAKPWQLYATLGVLVGGGANLMSFTAQSLFLPNWFVRRRGLSISIAFSGVGAGAIVLLPALQAIIVRDGWRASCWAMGLLVLFVLGPLNLLVWRRPEDIGLSPDGESDATSLATPHNSQSIVDPAWASVDWTLARAIRTGPFWWIALGYFCALFAWYAVQVHQTKYLTEIGFSPLVAAWALGIVSVVAIPGQIGLGALSDRVGREWVWSAGCCGFAICYMTLIALEHSPSYGLLYLMVMSQGLLGYALTSVMGPIVVEIFEGPHYGAIFGTITVALIGGGAAGPWVAGIVQD
ncbi:MAG TPA: MFS transporter, partial [Rhodopila sp.]